MLLPWLLVTGALAAVGGATGDLGVADNVGVTTDPGVTGSTVNTDYPASSDQDVPYVEGRAGAARDAACPPGCEECPTTDVRMFFCGGQQLNYLPTDTGYMELVCQDVPLNCSKVPPLPARRSGPLQRVEVTSCLIPPNMALTCATGGEDALAISVSYGLSSLTAENVRGLNAEELFLTFKPGAVHEMPMSAVEALPRLRTLRVRQGTALQLHGRMFVDAPPLTFLEVSMSGVRALPPHTFAGLRRLRMLSLWGNDITHLEEDSLAGLSSLETLVLDGNPLVEVAARALGRAPRLRTLSLERVELRALHEGVFEGLDHLEQVSIECEGEGEGEGEGESEAPPLVESRAFSQLPALRELSVTHARVTSLPHDVFLDTTDIVNLTLANNMLESVPAQALVALQSLARLELQHNRLRALAPDSFLQLRALRHLVLDHNHIQELPPYLFSGVRSLRSVSLAHNDLSSVSYAAFSGAGSLLHLSLSHNRLEWAPADVEISSPFNMLLDLQTLDLSHNNISIVYSDWRYIMRNLTSLDLSYNNLALLSQADVQFIDSPAVDLRHNNISSVQPREPWADMLSASGARLALGGNPFHCDCMLYDFLTQVQSGDGKYDVEGASCASPAPLAHQPLRRVRLREVTCPMRDVTPGCGCLVRPLLDAAECVCNHTRVPSISESGVSEMYLRLTRASSLRELPPAVTTVNLTGLRLRRVPDAPPSVRLLDLTDNDIETVPETAFRHNLTLLLAGNPLSCECSAAEEVASLHAHRHRVADYSSVACADGAPLAAVDARASCAARRAVLSGAALAALLILVATLAALLYYCRVELQVVLHSRGWCLRLLAREPPERKKYDVFVSFAPADEKYVAEELLPRLEAGGYSLLVQDRDWEAGSTIPAELHRSVLEARRTLLVVTPAFLACAWCAEGARAAHAHAARDRRRRAVAVLRGVRARALPPDARAHLALAARLREGEPLFWDKLRFALPPPSGGGGAGGKKAAGGLHVVLNDEGELVNRGYVKDVV